jgi:hypothetical protein
MNDQRRGTRTAMGAWSGLAWRLALGAGLLGLLDPHAPVALAEAEPSTPPNAAAALLAVADADPLELARVVQRYGDAAVLALLASDQQPSARLSAVRASPWLSEPERALPLLASLFALRDSDLAPAAARAALEISKALDYDTLARREVLPSELSAVLVELRRAAQQSWVRVDLRLMAGVAATQLEAAGVPPPPKPK